MRPKTRQFRAIDQDEEQCIRTNLKLITPTERPRDRFLVARRASPPISFLSLIIAMAGIIGSLYLVLVPPFQVPDEFAHFTRAVSVSRGHCVAQVATPVPGELVKMASAFPSAMDTQTGPGRWISSSDLLKWADGQLANSRPEPVGNAVANLYSCVPYLPSAASIEVTTLAGFPPLAVLYAGRLANLVSFLVLVYAALRAVPDFHLQLATLVLMPMTLQQAASLSADALTLGICFYFVCYVLKLSFDKNVALITRKELLVLVATVVFSSLTKFNLWLILLALLIPSEKFLNRRRRWGFVIGLLILACVTAAAWQIANRQNFPTFLAVKKAANVDVIANSAFVWQHPGLILTDVGQTFELLGTGNLVMFVGDLGWLTIPLPFRVVLLYLLCLFVVALTQTHLIRFKARHRCLFLFVFLASTISLCVLMFNFEAHRDYIIQASPQEAPIPGLQGRYFIPFAFVLLLVFSNHKLRLPRRFGLIVVLVMAVTANATAFGLIWKDYYLGPAAKKMEGQAIQYPDGRVFLVMKGYLHYIPNPSTLAILNLHTPIHKVSNAYPIPLGSPVPVFPGRVIRVAGQPEIYYIDGAQLHHIPDPTTLAAMGVQNQVHLVSPMVEQSIPVGAPLAHLNGTEKKGE